MTNILEKINVVRVNFVGDVDEYPLTLRREDDLSENDIAFERFLKSFMTKPVGIRPVYGNKGNLFFINMSNITFISVEKEEEPQ